MILTTKQLTEKFGTDTYGLITFLKVKGIITEAGHAPKAPGAKGKPATLYSFDPATVGTELQKLFASIQE